MSSSNSNAIIADSTRTIEHHVSKRKIVKVHKGNIISDTHFYHLGLAHFRNFLDQNNER